MIAVIGNEVTFSGSYQDLDAEVAMILVHYTDSLQKNNIAPKEICEDLLNYQKLLGAIAECILKGHNVLDNADSILDKVFE